MCAKKIHHIVTIDESDTRKREDGFYTNSDVGGLAIASYVPDRRSEQIEALTTGLRKNWMRPPNDVFYSRARAGNHFCQEMPKKALVCHLNESYSKVSIFGLKVSIGTIYSYAGADAKMTDDPQLQALGHFIYSLGYPTISTRYMIPILMKRFNAECMKVFRDKKIPHLGRNSRREIVIDNGLVTVSHPLRDATAHFNSLQLSHYLETREILFSKDALLELVFGPPSFGKSAK